MLLTWLSVTVGLFCVLLALLFYYFTCTFNYWRSRGIKFIKPVPFVGSLLPVITMKEHMLSFVHRNYHHYQGEQIVGYFQGRTPAVMVRDPELLKNILVKDFGHFVDHGFKIDEEADPLEAKNIFNMEGDRWRQMRTKLTPTFTSGRIKAMLPLLQECADNLELVLKKVADSGDSIEFKELLSCYTTDVIGSTVFGIKCNSLNDPGCQFRVMGNKIMKVDFWRGLKSFVMFFLPEIGLRLKLSFLSAEVTQFFRSMVRDVISLRVKTGETRKDFMQLLMELKEKGRISGEDNEIRSDDHDDMKLTEDDVTAQAMAFFTAGFETSSSVMSFALLELGGNPDVQRRVQQEIDRVLQKHQGEITYQTLQDLTYLDFVLHETMRKWPPLVSLQRICTKNYIVPELEVTIEEGTPILIPIHALQNDPEYFTDPEKFDPDRFSNDETSQKNKYVYMPFGEGPRQCIGNRFAMLQSKLGLLTVLRKYDLTLTSPTRYPPVIDEKQFMLSTKDAVWAKVTPREMST